MSSPPRVAIVVLNWNGWEDTKECLESLREVTYPSMEVYVVDNGSIDGSPEKIAGGFPEVRLLPLPNNLGFGGGMNAGLEAALEDGHDFFLCLNNDMVVDPAFLQPLVAATDEDKVVPYPILNKYAKPEAIDSVGHRVSLFTGITRPVAPGQPGLPESVQLMSRELLETVGGWKEEYFAMYEDTEYNLRIREAGWRFVCIPESKLYHKRGRTSGRVPGLVSYYSIRNRIRLVEAYGNRWQRLTTLLHILVLTLPYIALRRLITPRYKHLVGYVLLGLADGLLPWRRSISRSWRMRP